jgi:hypothetical protein
MTLVAGLLQEEALLDGVERSITRASKALHGR